mmetsp:Transcript_137633/g.427567  ORF Transcript_137633/g.427567 Transcript_137633/m.427567 type:complete len:221 (-) Transcript_137633:19-681(-)
MGASELRGQRDPRCQAPRCAHAVVHGSPPCQARGGSARAQGGASRLRPLPNRSWMPVQGCDAGDAATDGAGPQVDGDVATAARRARGAGGERSRGPVVHQRRADGGRGGGARGLRAVLRVECRAGPARVRPPGADGGLLAGRDWRQAKRGGAVRAASGGMHCQRGEWLAPRLVLAWQLASRESGGVHRASSRLHCVVRGAALRPCPHQGSVELGGLLFGP